MDLSETTAGGLPVPDAGHSPFQRQSGSNAAAQHLGDHLHDADSFEARWSKCGFPEPTVFGLSARALEPLAYRVNYEKFLSSVREPPRQAKFLTYVCDVVLQAGHGALAGC